MPNISPNFARGLADEGIRMDKNPPKTKLAKKKGNKAARLASAPWKPIPAQTTAWPWICLGLILLFVVAVRIRFLSVPLERDEGEFAYAGQLILEGIPPYQLAYNVKLPGIYAAYALVMAVFGQTAFGIHLGLLFVNLGGIVLLFFLARRLFDPYAAVIASATYALMSTSPSVLGFQAHATHFVILAALGGFVLLLRGLESRRALTLFWSGLLFGVAVLMKQHGVFLGVFAFGVLLYNEWSSKIAANSAGSPGGSLQGPGTDAKKSLLPRLRRLAAFSVGTVVPYVLACIVLWRAGAFNNFWRWTVVYAGGHSLPYSFQGLARNFQYNGPDNFFWGLAAASFFVLCADRSVSGWTKGFVGGLLASSFVAVSLGFYFFSHYFVLMLPAVALLVGAGCSLTRQRLLQARIGRPTSLLPIAIFLATCGLVLAKNSWYYFEQSPSAIFQKIYYDNPSFVAAPEISRYISNHSTPASRVAVFGSEPEIYFYAHRHAASGYIYMYDITSPAERAGEMKQEMLREVEAARPEFVVDVHEQLSWSLGFSPETHRIHEWLEKYLESGNFRRVAVAEDVDGKIVYRWDLDAAGYSPASERHICVYQRKL
jgi:dolichyl-phosphate-mannose-protein mannosyltransferase